MPESTWCWCERCGSTHVDEAHFRKGTLAAGLDIDPEESLILLHRLPIAGADDAGGPAYAQLLRRFVHLIGPTCPDRLAA